MAEDTKPNKRDAKKLLKRIRERYKVMVEADHENRKKALDDLEFVHIPGKQWDAVVKRERGADRPCYEFNKLRVTIKRVVNEIRANRPQGKVRAVEDGDKDTADVIEGLIRNIWNVSKGDTILDYAAEYQVGCGMGAWRVNVKYSNDTVFDQDIVIEPVKNPFTLYADPAASDPIKADARDWIITEMMGNEAYDERWPKKERVSFEDGEFDEDHEWADENSTRVCEYWWKEPTTKTLLMLENGKTIDASKHDGTTPIKKSRTIKCHKVMMCIASGEAILEGPTEWAGSHFPFVQIYGDWLVIDGKVIWYGLTRMSRDAQMIHNYAFTSAYESIALAPHAQYWATVEQAQGNLDNWSEAHKKLFPFMVYNADPKAPGPPQRMQGAQVPAAQVQAMQITSEEIKATSGIFDNSLGMEANEKSGRAITARQQQGEIATFNYRDNASKGVERTWDILIDLIPKVYDTQRSVRILGVDGAEKYVKVNEVRQGPNGEITKVHDLAAGKFDTTVTTGPSFATQRQEATEMYTQLGQAVPAVWSVAGDLIMKSMDLPYSDQIAERMKALLPPQIQQTLTEGKPVPPEVQAVMNQAQQAMAMVEQQGQMIQEAAAELQKEKAAVDKGKAEIQQKIADLQTKQAQFEAQVAKAVAGIAQKEAGLQVKQSQSQAADVEGERQSMVAEAQQAIQTIQQLALEMAQFGAQIMQAIEQRSAMPAPPRRRQVRAKRVNGELVGIMEEMDELGNITGSREMKVRRENGELVGEA